MDKDEYLLDVLSVLRDIVIQLGVTNQNLENINTALERMEDE